MRLAAAAAASLRRGRIPGVALLRLPRRCLGGSQRMGHDWWRDLVLQRDRVYGVSGATGLTMPKPDAL